MNIIAEFSHSIITELNYKVTKSTSSIIKDQIDKLEHVKESTQGRLAIQNDLTSFMVEIVTDLTSVVDEKPYRSLELSINFFFDLIVKDQNGEDFKITDENNKEIMMEIYENVESLFLVMCRQQLKEIIRQVTSIDYQLPIITEKIKVSFVE
ncbi:hypothetical protein [Bacillus cereus]|uniref:hypothetical protein n=1 Tax=Bacillus cereus TaxID=1396 RepID=UPI000BF368AC|nr:hypothetical protein [Bacillus cereus]PER97018.1 hypothetical protein CN500_11285 [Bacillus cereus]